MSNKLKYALKIAYMGTKYHGWQVQPHKTTVQSVVEQALALVNHHPTPTICAGRTDAGVHAQGQYISFQTLPIHAPSKYLYQLNCILPNDIAVTELFLAESNFNARFDAVSRCYRYKIARKKNPFLMDTSLLYTGYLDLDAMKEAQNKLKLYDDFACFCKNHGNEKTTLCKIIDSQWFEDPDLWVFQIEANRFLRGMVRAIVGTLLEIGKGHRCVDSFDMILQSKDRKQAGMNAPANGLTLFEVKYPNDCLKRLC